MTNATDTKVIHFNRLMFGDRFRFIGDLEGTDYGTVTHTQDYIDGHCDAATLGGASFHRSGWAKVVLLHRAPNCGCGHHVDFCENECPWPTELEDLWQSLYGG